MFKEIWGLDLVCFVGVGNLGRRVPGGLVDLGWGAVGTTAAGRRPAPQWGVFKEIWGLDLVCFVGVGNLGRRVRGGLVDLGWGGRSGRPPQAGGLPHSGECSRKFGDSIWFVLLGLGIGGSIVAFGVWCYGSVAAWFDRCSKTPLGLVRIVRMAIVPLCSPLHGPVLVDRWQVKRVPGEVCAGAAVDALADSLSDSLAVVRERFGFLPDARQAEVLENRASRLLVCCTRQWGKSTLAAALAALRAMEAAAMGEQGLVVCLSPTMRQTRELLLKVALFLRRAGELKSQCLSGSGGKLELVLRSGARVSGLPGRQDGVRGASAPRLVILDEAAKIPDEVYLAARPMLAAGAGELVMVSTPFGEQGFFWKAWTAGGAEWTRVSVKATECERIRPEFLAEERRAMGEDWFRQEYLCEFVGAADAAFRGEWFDWALERQGDWPKVGLPW